MKPLVTCVLASFLNKKNVKLKMGGSRKRQSIIKWLWVNSETFDFVCPESRYVQDFATHCSRSIQQWWLVYINLRQMTPFLQSEKARELKTHRQLKVYSWHDYPSFFTCKLLRMAFSKMYDLSQYQNHADFSEHLK